MTLREVLAMWWRPRAARASAAAVEIRAYAHPDAFPPAVKQLFDAATVHSVELGAAWYRNFVDTVELAHTEPHFYVLSTNGRPMAALPVLIRQRAVPGHRDVQSLTNYYTALYAPVLEQGADVALIATLLRFIVAEHASVGQMRFVPMDPGSAGYAILVQALPRAGMLPFEFFCFGNWYLRVAGDWQAHLATFNSKMRNTIKRMGKKLANDGGSLEIITASKDLPRGLAAYRQVYDQSWKVKEPFPKFVPGLIETAAEHGWLRLGVVWLNGNAIAAQLWLVDNRKADIYKVAYDEAFKAYSPGTLLTAHLMQHVIDRDGVAEVDYLIGDDPYKKGWMSDRRERWGIVAYNVRSVAGLYGATREALGRAARPLVRRWRARGVAAKAH